MEQPHGGVRKAFKYKLKPTPAQTRMFERTLMLCRQVYNAAVSERREAWRMRGVTVTYYQQKAELPGIKEALPEYAEVNSQVLQDVVLRVERAYQAFFQRMQAGETPGYPRFQGRRRYHSFTYPQVGEHGGARLDIGGLVLSKIGRVAVRWSRPVDGTPKTITISQEADGWYLIISCDKVPVQPLAPTGYETGIDVGLKVFLITASGQIVENPRHYRRAERYLAKCQRRVARRQKGSHRRRTAITSLAKAHQHVLRQRADFHHKTALALLRAHDTIYLEELQVANMAQNRHLAKSIHDAGWAQFRAILNAKAVCAGRRVITVPAHYTTQECSGCGERVPKSLNVRTHICPSCGLVLDRDHNAALNIQRAGQALRGVVA
jgi:putative transposase